MLVTTLAQIISGTEHDRDKPITHAEKGALMEFGKSGKCDTAE